MAVRAYFRCRRRNTNIADFERGLARLEGRQVFGKIIVDADGRSALQAVRQHPGRLGCGRIDPRDQTPRSQAHGELYRALMRKIGPLFKEHRLGRENLRAAFPEKSDAEIEIILGGVWDNLGRVAVDFAHLDEFSLQGFGTPTPDVVTYEPATLARYHEILKRNGPITFAAHIANWELPGMSARLTGMKSAVLFRRPNIKTVSDAIVKLRTPLMGELVPTTLDAPVKLARRLKLESMSACWPISITLEAPR